MVKLFGRGRKDRDELDAQILEDVDLSAIVEQKRRQQQSESRPEAETASKTESETSISSMTTSASSRSVTEIFHEEFMEWLIEQALRDESKYRKLLDSIDSLDVENLRRLCRILLRKLRES